LVLVVGFLTLASLGQHFLDYVWSREGWGHEEIIAIPLRFNVGEDANAPTWYSSFALLLCSVLLAAIAAAKKRRSDRYTLHWAALSVIFLLMSIDEVATIHEALGETVGAVAELFIGYAPGGLLYAAWVIPGAIFVLVVALAYLRFFFHLPSSTKLWFLVAAALFVGGAIGMEMLSARLSSFYGWENLENVPDNVKMVIAIQTAIEELLEMLGVIVFIYALLSYASSYVNEITLRIHAGDK
jgi:hypothetical protein